MVCIKSKINIKMIVLSFFSVINIAHISSAAEAAKYNVEIRCDHKDALYTCGEKAVFTIKATSSGKLLDAGIAQVTVSNDGYKKIQEKEIDLAKENPLTISGTMAEPGFLQCSVKLKETGKKVSWLAAAGFEPEKIKAATTLPDDFMRFWHNSLKLLDKIPIDIKINKLDKFSSATFNCYKISFANIGNSRMHGFLSVPAGKGPFPALVTIPGAGPGFYTPDTEWVKRGVIVLKINIHKYDPPMDRAELFKKYRELNKSKSYWGQGTPDRNKFYYRRAILGLDRAVKWLTTRSDWDKKHLVAFGSSQGGGLSLILSGLNKKITAVGVNVPALCDHAAYLADRMPGWPRMVLAGRKKPDSLHMSAYYDAVNFAGYIKCPALFGVGFIDVACSPSSVYAAYNAVKTPKKIHNSPLTGHAWNADYKKILDRWISGQLGMEKPVYPDK